jgi:phytoene dehydrogenase-like protein
MIQGFKNFARPRTLLGWIAYPFQMTKTINLFRQYRDVPVPEFAARYFAEGSDLYNLFGHMGYPEMSALILAASFWTMIEDYWTVKDGMQSWADALAQNFTTLGGELKLKTKVDRILTENGSAIGVESKGEIFKADYVVSASDYKKTFLSLLDNRALLPEDFIVRMEEAPVSESFFTVYLGLDMPVDELRTHMKIFHLFYYDQPPDYDIANNNDTDFFKKVSPALYSPSLMNNELARTSHSSLMIQCMCPHRWMGNWGGDDRTTYDKLKQNATEALIKKTTEIVPDLEKHIIFKDAATPRTYERYTHNTDGASSAWSWNPKKKYYKNPMGVHVTTPVKNLLLSSCWTGQIGGVPTAINAAYKCMKLIK